MEFNLIAFVRSCFGNINKPHISSINDFIATEILSNIFSWFLLLELAM